MDYFEFILICKIGFLNYFGFNLNFQLFWIHYDYSQIVSRITRFIIIKSKHSIIIAMKNDIAMHILDHGCRN